MYFKIPSYEYSGYIVDDFGDSLSFSINYGGSESKADASTFLYLSIGVPFLLDFEVVTNTFQWIASGMTAPSFGYGGLFFKFPIELDNDWLFYPKIGLAAEILSYDPYTVYVEHSNITTYGFDFLYISGTKYYISELTATSPSFSYGAAYISTGIEFQWNLVHLELIWLALKYYESFDYTPGEIKLGLLKVKDFINKDDIVVDILSQSTIFLSVSIGF